MDETMVFLLSVLEENWRHARQAEDKRTTMANIILLITTAIQIAIVFVGFTGKTFLLPVFQVFLGIYALIATTKLYERSQFHILRARKLRARLDEFYPDAQVEQLQKEAEAEHQKHSPLWMKVRLNFIWSGLYIGVMTLALGEIVLYLFYHAGK